MEEVAGFKTTVPTNTPGWLQFEKSAFVEDGRILTLKTHRRLFTVFSIIFLNGIHLKMEDEPDYI